MKTTTVILRSSPLVTAQFSVKSASLWISLLQIQETFYLTAEMCFQTENKETASVNQAPTTGMKLGEW